MATDLRDGKKVVIKLAFKEFNTLQKLDHPNIVKAYDFVETVNKKTEGHSCLITEYIEGDTLETYIKKNAPLKEDQFKILFLPLIDAINYLSTKHKLVHGDIASNNIMIRKKDGFPVMIDFEYTPKNGNYYKFKRPIMNLVKGEVRSSPNRELIFIMLRCMARKGCIVRNGGKSKGEYRDSFVKIAEAEKNGYSKSLLKMIEKQLRFPYRNYYDEWFKLLSNKK